MRILEITKENCDGILRELKERSPEAFPEQEQRVREILTDVRTRGDAALFDWAERLDGLRLDAHSVEVTEAELLDAEKNVDPALPAVMKKALVNIRAFHEKQKQNSWITEDKGILLGMRVLPMERVGVYVPGGKAAYPSSVLMNIAPAKAAGVKEIIMVTPCGKSGVLDPAVLVAAKMAGADRIFKIGGAQAVAALAYGTESIPRVDKIVGPGNIYVALAKKAVFGSVSIDSVAGPSEILVLADETADPRFVAADLLSQAEHDEMASSVLVTTSRQLADRVQDEIDVFLKTLSRSDIIRKSLDNYGYTLIAGNMEEAVELTNAFAPEHLEIQTADPMDVLSEIKNAGAVFIGPYSSEPLGDYFAGPNHVLPTSGTARFFSPLSVDDFVKKSSLIRYSREALEAVHREIESFATCEQLTAHANSVAVRFENKDRHKGGDAQ